MTNGDCAADTLRRVVNGAVTITADPLHEGPAPALDGDAWYDVRARFLSNGGASHDATKAQLAAWDRAILDGSRDGHVVLWFEHDLFDQLLLVRTLDLIGGPGGTARAEHAALICIDRFPGVERFVGLGQLTAAQLGTLVGTERPIAREQYALASETWAAFRSPDPRALFQITVRLKADTTYGGEESGHGLPFLRDALRRFFAEYPSTANGLSQTAQFALEALAEGPMAGGALFAAAQSREARPFMGDTSFFHLLRLLGSARVPIVSASGRPPDPDVR